MCHHSGISAINMALRAILSCTRQPKPMESQNNVEKIVERAMQTLRSQFPGNAKHWKNESFSLPYVDGNDPISLPLIHGHHGLLQTIDHAVVMCSP